MSAGEAVGDAVFGWCRDELGLVVNEMFGQTEINYIVGNCTRSLEGFGQAAPGWPALPGSMGRAYPGHRVALLGDQGGEVGRVVDPTAVDIAARVGRVPEASAVGVGRAVRMQVDHPAPGGGGPEAQVVQEEHKLQLEVQLLVLLVVQIMMLDLVIKVLLHLVWVVVVV